MGVAAKRYLFTVEDYYKMAEAGILSPEDRVELIHGQIVRMSPIKSPHGGCVKRLNALLNQLFGETAIVSIQDPLKLGKFSEPEPDLMLLKPAPDFYATQHPVPQDVYLLIEVADTSLAYDRKVKLPLYAESGIPCVWIVNLPERCVEVYSVPEGKAYKTKQVFMPADAVMVQPFEVKLEVNRVLGK